MNENSQRSICTLFVVSLIIVRAPVAVGADYRFSIVAKEGQTIDGRTLASIGDFSMNDTGDIVFVSTIATGGNGIFTRAAKLADSNDVISGLDLISVSNPSINDNGDIAFKANFLPNGSGIFSPNAVRIRTGDVIGGKTLRSISNPVINNNDVGDQLAFHGSFTGGGGVFTNTQLVASSGQDLAGRTLHSFDQVVSVTDNSVAFRANFKDGGSGIFLGNELIAEAGSEISRTITSIQLEPPSASTSGGDSENIAFLANFDGGSGIFTRNSLVAETGETIDSGGPITGLGDQRINSSGQVVFVGSIGSVRGIFTETPPQFLISTNDKVDGMQLTGVNSPIFSSNGQVAFLANFLGGISAVVKGTPDCDFDDDGGCRSNDLDELLAIGPLRDGVVATPDNEQFDMDGNGTIDVADAELWLSNAARRNGFDAPYFRGDANLDGVVDVSDFNNWNANKFTQDLRWSRGDYNADGVVDVTDFNDWNSNKFRSLSGGDRPTAIPEPDLGWMTVMAWFALLRCQANRRGRNSAFWMWLSADETQQRCAVQ